MAGNIEVTQDDSGRYGVRNATQKGRGRCSHVALRLLRQRNTKRSLTANPLVGERRK